MSVLKVHYFLWFGSLAGIMPFVSIFAKEHSVANAEDVGILYFVLPFVVSVLKPLFCSIADRNDCHKKVLIISIVTTLVGYGLLVTNIYINMSWFSWYWFCILILLANSGQGVVISLNDYLVMKEVTELDRSFGSYRVFGTIGWGGLGIVAGIVNEYITQLPYLLPGLLLFIIFEMIDLFCIYGKLKDNRLDNNSTIVANIEQNTNDLMAKNLMTKPLIALSKTLKHIHRIFLNNPSLLQYIVIVLICGSLTAFHWNYYFWFIEEIRGKDGLLMGLALFVQSFLGELPIFLISDHILRYCGTSLSLNISLIAFTARYFLYGYVFEKGTSYWVILPVEVLQGLTFGLFYTVMTDLAQHYAIEDNKRFRRSRDDHKIKYSLEKSVNDVESVESVDNERKDHNSYALMQGIMSGAFEGVGLGVGALVGGFVIERIDVFYIWKIGAFLSCFTLIFNLFIDFIKYLMKK